MFGSFDPDILLWLIVIVIFVAMELSTVTLTSIWFAAGGLAALFVAMLGGNLIVQIIAFLIVAFGLLALTRKWSDKFLDGKKQSTNADRAIGEIVRVTERVNNLDRTGRAIVHGQDWTVRTEDDDITIEKGELVRVLQIKGVKLIVEKVEEE
ncbi:MAG: NfeD family protein [Lachnospiraceae bacterium]|nr:NfeD family protein [Lachnospiraceae bacterium]